MDGMHNWTQFDQARFDLLPLVIWSRVFWPSDGQNTRDQIRGVEGRNAPDQIAFRGAFHSFLVE